MQECTPFVHITVRSVGRRLLESDCGREKDSNLTDMSCIVNAIYQEASFMLLFTISDLCTLPVSLASEQTPEC